MSSEGIVNAPRNYEFETWRDSLPEKHWAKYDLSACRLGWEAAIEFCKRIRWIGTPIEAEAAVWEGLQRIAAERTRQILAEGYTAEHDDKHDKGELAIAGACYALAGAGRAPQPVVDWRIWPWGAEWWKPSADPIRNLEKAGALIAAEIERLVRLKKKEMAP